MKAHRIATALAIALPLASLPTLYAVDAHSCSPPMYEMYHADIVEEDTPECVEIDDFPQHHYDGDWLFVDVTNHCEEDLELHIIDCPAYDEEATAQAEEFTCRDLIVGPGATEWLVVEQRPTGELEDGETHEQIYSWHLGEDEGIVHTKYEFEDPHADIDDDHDRTGGCAMMEDNPYPFAGCSTAGASLPMDVMILLAIAFGALVVRRRWSARDESTGHA